MGQRAGRFTTTATVSENRSGRADSPYLEQATTCLAPGGPQTLCPFVLGFEQWGDVDGGPPSDPVVRRLASGTEGERRLFQVLHCPASADVDDDETDTRRLLSR